MHPTHIWYQLDLHRRKIVSVFFFILLISFSQGWAQDTKWKTKYKSGDDDKLISYGFFLAAHSHSYRLRYSEAFLDTSNVFTRNQKAIMPRYATGFALGFIGNVRLHDQLDIRITPKISFYQYGIEVRYTDAPSDEILIENTKVEFPLLLKYKSIRRMNSRAYMIGGINPMIEGRKRDNIEVAPISTLTYDLALELGFGFDLYFEYFKFSPEIRYSHGLINIFDPTTSNPEFATGIASIRSHTITLYLNFQ